MDSIKKIGGAVVKALPMILVALVVVKFAKKKVPALEQWI